MSGHHGNQTKIKARHYKTNKPVLVTLADGVIFKMEILSGAESESVGNWPQIAPGLVDLQINGYKNLDFNRFPVSVDTVKQATRALWEEGVTTFLPTVITNSDQSIEQAVGAIALACDEDPASDAGIAGIHVEGPFISTEEGARGAHKKKYVTAPNWEWFQRWQEAAGWRIKILTLSPEWPEAASFIEKCTDSGVVVSIGHTAASVEQIREAVNAGAKMSTHLGNGSHLMIPRHRNYIWEQLADDRLTAGIISDGFHLPESLLKIFCKVKRRRAFIVSDATHLSGMPEGEYGYEAHEHGVVKTKEGKLHVKGNSELLAGSAQMQPWGIRHLVRSQICDLPEAWDKASIIPAGIMKFPVEQGLKVGFPADLVLFKWEKEEEEISILQTYKNGKPCLSFGS